MTEPRDSQRYLAQGFFTFDDLSLQGWLEHLRLLFPIAGVVHVGAGSSRAVSRYEDWAVPSVVFVEADENLHDEMVPLVQKHGGWLAHRALVSDGEYEADFYVASNPSESGVLSPEILAGLWRNLKTREQRRVRATTLASILHASNRPPETVNWAVIDCLPALPVLQGAMQYLEAWDVVMARVVLDEPRLPARGAGKSEVDAFLSGHGYRCLAWEEELQPAIGRVLYVRDWKALLGSSLKELRAHDSQRESEHALSTQLLKEARDEQERLAAERQAQLEQLIRANSEQTQLAAERQELIEQLTKARDEQVTLAAQQEQQLEQLAESRDQQATLAAEQREQIERLAEARDEQARLATVERERLEQTRRAHDEQAVLAAERLQRLDQLTQMLNEHARLATERQALIEQLGKARDDQARLAGERQAQIDQLTKLAGERANQIVQLEADRAELEVRQGRLDHEMVKAEAQIELIKDVILREKAF